jgi:hypothetical protein
MVCQLAHVLTSPCSDLLCAHHLGLVGDMAWWGVAQVQRRLALSPVLVEFPIQTHSIDFISIDFI